MEKQNTVWDLDIKVKRSSDFERFTQFDSYSHISYVGATIFASENM